MLISPPCLLPSFISRFALPPSLAQAAHALLAEGFELDPEAFHALCRACFPTAEDYKSPPVIRLVLGVCEGLQVRACRARACTRAHVVGRVRGRRRSWLTRARSPWAPPTTERHR